MDELNKKNGLKILLVDDEPANIMLLTKILSATGYSNIVSTLDPKEVILLHQKHDFDLILLDINMPSMDGYEVLEELKLMHNFENTQVIAITGDIYTQDVNKGINAGFSGYLTKPIQIPALLEVADKALLSLSQ